MAPIRKDKVRKVVRRFPKKEIEVERVICDSVHPRVTLNHPRTTRIVKDAIHMDPLLVNLALSHTPSGLKLKYRNPGT